MKMVEVYGRFDCKESQEIKWLLRSYRIGFVFFPDDSEDYSAPQVIWNDKNIGGLKELQEEIENTGIGNYGQGAF